MKITCRVGIMTIAFLVVMLVFMCAQQKPLRSGEPEVQAKSGVTESHPDVDFSMGCVECHTSMTPAVVTTWDASLHGQANVKCYVCHGDAREEFYPAGNDERCSGCHSAKAVDFVSLPETSCFDCHNGHTLKFHTSESISRVRSRTTGFQQ